MPDDRVTQELEIEAPPAEVFAALIEPEQLARWWGSTDMYATAWTVDPRVGGEYVCVATMGDGTELTVRGRFLEIAPPRRLAYTWNAGWDPSGETTVVFELVPRGPATLVRVTQEGFAAGADRDGYDDGWRRILAWLDSYIRAGAAGAAVDRPGR